MNQLEPITVAQIGCGYWGPNLLRNFSSLPSCRVKYLVDASEERRRFAESSYPGTLATGEMARALEDSEVRGVIIATPAATHVEIASQALRAGKNIFVEKPIAMKVAEIDALAALAKPAGLKIMAGHTFIYHPAVAFLKDMADSGELGELRCAYTQRLNLGLARSDVNALWNLAPHDVSILCHVIGRPPETVQAAGTAFLQPGVEDVIFMNFQYPNKVLANSHVSWLDPNKTRKVTVIGSKKMVVYDDVLDEKLAIYDKGIDLAEAAGQAPKFAYRAGPAVVPKIAGTEPLRAEAEHFVTCIRTGTEPMTGVAHSRMVTQALEAAQTSLKGGGVSMACC
jgi:predicted dehydrogenase